MMSAPGSISPFVASWALRRVVVKPPQKYCLGEVAGIDLYVRGARPPWAGLKPASNVWNQRGLHAADETDVTVSLQRGRGSDQERAS